MKIILIISMLLSVQSAFSNDRAERLRLRLEKLDAILNQLVTAVIENENTERLVDRKNPYIRSEEAKFYLSQQSDEIQQLREKLTTLNSEEGCAIYVDQLIQEAKELANFEVMIDRKNPYARGEDAKQILKMQEERMKNTKWVIKIGCHSVL